MQYLDFEKPIADLEGKISELRNLSDTDGINIANEVAKLELRLKKLLTQTYNKLSPTERVMVARHAARPHGLDYIDGLIEDFQPLAGDRNFAEDAALIGGLGRFRGYTVMVLAQEKGHDTETRIKHNFGMARPEGYRKAQRLMQLATRFDIPIISFVDTAGAYPGIGAEERGQAEAIAKTIEACLNLPVPLVATIIGEGGSGGAIALAAADKVLMLEHSIYSVISPEGCASILWRDAGKAAEATKALKLTAADLKGFDVIDTIIKEPLGGAQREPKKAIEAVGNEISRHLDDLRNIGGEELKRRRRDKFLAMGT